jgi:hypothetical protein
VFLSEGPAYTITTGDVDYTLYGEVEVPSSILPSGYYPPIRSTPTGVVQEPGPRDGTYDAGGRTVTITATRVGQLTICDCVAVDGEWQSVDCVTTPIDATQTATRTGVSTITVKGLDFTGVSNPCGNPINVGLGSFRIDVNNINILVLRTGVINSYGRSVELSEVDNVTVTFADDPGNPVPLESLPKLS